MEGKLRGRVVFCTENLNFNIKLFFQIKKRESDMKTSRAGGNLAL